jgi:hypothetical protein
MSINGVSRRLRRSGRIETSRREFEHSYHPYTVATGIRVSRNTQAHGRGSVT